MNWWKKLRKRRRLEEDLSEELSFHLEMRSRDTEAPPFGNVLRNQRASRLLLEQGAFSMRRLPARPWQS
jgi:hypothetical protein